jgi:oligoribonuclease NrnB/cAMP/cGMP phosphodiesterase (DHH superfamily)
MKQFYADVVIYHAPCFDGSLSAFLVTDYHILHKVDKPVLIGIEPGAVLNDEISAKCVNRNVLMLDVMYNAADTKVLQEKCKMLCVIDHHRSNIIAAGDVFDSDNAILDESDAACILTYNWLYGGFVKPLKFIQYVAARDMFNFDDPNVKPFSTGLFAEVKVNDIFAIYNMCLTDPPFVDVLIKQGKELLKRDEIIIEHICSTARKYTITINVTTYTVYAASTHAYRSEVGNKLAGRDCDFGVTYHYDIKSAEWWVSLRGTKESTIDLSVVAKGLVPDGGGHPKASGITWKGSLSELLVSCTL